DILCVLEEMAMLMEAEFQIKNDPKNYPKPKLLKIFTSPPSADENGGLGWRKPEKVEEFIKNYKLLFPD
ncbi:MAG: hypothetical protein NT078_00530, partial [Candidatus Azambacteria bacterium]|nr:hypothetical protein [Candidatus Azambacteria bacterium]